MPRMTGPQMPQSRPSSRLLSRLLCRWELDRDRRGGSHGAAATGRGFHEEPIWEDWGLWLRCHARGATFEPVTRAIYRQHVSGNSRNMVGDARMRDTWRRKIRESALGPQ